MARELPPAVLAELAILESNPAGIGDPDVAAFRAYLEERLSVSQQTRITFRVVRDHEFFKLVHGSFMAAHWTREAQHNDACAIESLIDPTPFNPTFLKLSRAERALSWWERLVDPLVDLEEWWVQWRAARARRARLRMQRVVACVIERDGKYLVCQRPPHKRHGGLWEFPGGKLEKGENDEAAARRELREELNLEVVSAAPAIAGLKEPDSTFQIVFVPVVVRGDPKCLEHSAIRWGSPQELMDLPLAPTDEAFVRYLQHQARL